MFYHIFMYSNIDVNARDSLVKMEYNESRRFRDEYQIFYLYFEEEMKGINKRVRFRV